MFSSKFVICAVTLFVGVQALTEEQLEVTTNNHKACMAETHVNPALIFKAMQQGEFSEDPVFKEHLFCVSKRAGFQNEAGQIQEDVIRTWLVGEVQSAAIMAQCLVQRDTPQETAFQTMKCYYQYTHKQ